MNSSLLNSLDSRFRRDFIRVIYLTLEHLLKLEIGSKATGPIYEQSEYVQLIMAVNSAVEFFGSHAVSRKVHFSPKNKHSAEEGFFKTAIFYFTQFQLHGNKRKYL